ncbi:MAG: holo-ACP synthase [Myxococcales bacterium]|nr:holo-ACP synthase [Myxococcales bacterium]
MSILGIGNDLVDCARFEALLSEPGTHFASRTFTPAERHLARARAGREVEHLAARFAAKEATLKALSQALAPRRLPTALADLTEIEVLSDEDHRPSLVLSGAVLSLARAASVARLHVSLSHEHGYAAAFVVAEG